MQEFPSLQSVHLQPTEPVADSTANQLEFAAETRDLTDPNEPAEVTHTPVNIDGVPAERLMLIFQSRPCGKKVKCNSCAMCPFHANANPNLRDENIINQCRLTVERLKQFGISTKEDVGNLATLEQIGQFDIISSGSFFNDEEFPPMVREEILRTIASELPNIKKIVVESRAEFLDDQGENKLKVAQELINQVRQESGLPPVQLEYSIGVETTDPALRNGVLHKMLDREQLEQAVDLCQDGGVNYLQTYLLVKPHLVSETFAIEDAVRSARDVLDLAKKKGIKCRIALEPVFAGQATILDTLYKAGLYQPPNLWSVVEVARLVRQYIEENGMDAVVFVGLSDEGISKDRLTRSCDQCDSRVKAAIGRFNGTQELGDLECECDNCRGQWQSDREAEKQRYGKILRYVNDDTPLSVIEGGLKSLLSRTNVDIGRFSAKDLKLMQDRAADFPEGMAPIIHAEEGYVELVVFDQDRMERKLAAYYQAIDKRSSSQEALAA